MKTNHFNAWMRIAWFSLVAFTLLGTSSHSIVAQSQEPQKQTAEGQQQQTPEVQQLKERLQQLEWLFFLSYWPNRCSGYFLQSPNSQTVALILKLGLDRSTFSDRSQQQHL